MITFLLNDRITRMDVPPGTVILDIVRRLTGLKGTKEGCREGDCGACSILLGKAEGTRVRYRTVASCLLPAAELHGRHAVTIEGLCGSSLTPVQEAFVDEGATQCGFCTPGMVVGVTGFLLGDGAPDEDGLIAAIEGNICRCTGYASVRRAAGRILRGIGPTLSGAPDRARALINAGVLQPWFADSAAMLRSIPSGNEPSPGVVTLGGGTDLFVQRADALRDAPFRMLTREKDLEGIRMDGNDLVLGAATSMEALRASPLVRRLLPRAARAMRLVSSQLIRNQATLAGNIVNASPIGDVTSMLLALGGVLEIEGPAGRRVVPLARFFLGYKRVDLRSDEIVRAIRLPGAVEPPLFNFEKVSRRECLDIASVNSSIALRTDGGRIVSAALTAGGVAPIPLLLSDASKLLEGRTVAAGVIRSAADAADGEIAPISDVRGSAEYKRTLLRRLIFAHFIELFPDRGLDEELP